MRDPHLRHVGKPWMPPPRSTKAPNFGTETTRPASTAPHDHRARPRHSRAAPARDACGARDHVFAAVLVTRSPLEGIGHPTHLDRRCGRCRSASGQNARSRAIAPAALTPARPPSTASPAWNASSSSRGVRTPRRARCRHWSDHHRLDAIARTSIRRRRLSARDVDLRFALPPMLTGHLRPNRDHGAPTDWRG